MRNRWIRRILAGSALLAAVVPAAGAQMSGVAATGYTGVAVPFGRFADYAAPGASAGLQIEYPIRDPLALVLNAEVDNLQSNAPGLPDLRLWRYQAGLEADLVGSSADRWGIRGHLGAGATSFRSNPYYPNQRPSEATFEKTYFTGSGGLALVFGAGSPVHGYLGARVTWTPMTENDSVELGSAALGPAPDPVANAVSVPITLGLRVRA